MFSWFNHTPFFLGFMVIEALFVGISYLIVLREVDKYYEDPLIKSPRWTMFKIFVNHLVAMNILLVIVFFVGVFLDVIRGYFGIWNQPILIK